MNRLNVFLFFIILIVAGCTAEIDEGFIVDDFNASNESVNNSLHENKSATLPSNKTINKTGKVNMSMNLTETINLTNKSIGKNVSSNKTMTKNETKKDVFAERCKDTDVTDEKPDGINYQLKGSITIDGIAIKNGADYCNNIKHLAEWYCMNGIPQVNVYECPNECKDGVCT